MKNILITGSNGFIGKYFIDNYKDRYNIRTFSFLKNDINTLDLKDIDIVFHLSALVHQMSAASDAEYERVNVVQTLNLAQKAKKNGVKHFIFMSSVAVYGVETGVLEESTICNPITAYGKSKLKAECELLKLQDETFTLSFVRAPIVNGYNAPGNMKSLIELVNKVRVLPFKDVYNKRSMVYVGNLCYVIDAIAQQKKSGVFLVCDSEVLSTTQLVRFIADALGKKIYLVKIPFFESLLKFFKSSLYKRLYGSLEVDNTKSMQHLFGEEDIQLPYTLEESIMLMIKGIS